MRRTEYRLGPWKVAAPFKCTSHFAVLQDGGTFCKSGKMRFQSLSGATWKTGFPIKAVSRVTATAWFVGKEKPLSLGGGRSSLLMRVPERSRAGFLSGTKGRVKQTCLALHTKGRIPWQVLLKPAGDQSSLLLGAAAQE